MTKQMLEENGDNTDPLKMNKEELFNYIRGELIYRNKLSELINGFGVTQVANSINVKKTHWKL